MFGQWFGQWNGDTAGQWWGGAEAVAEVRRGGGDGKKRRLRLLAQRRRAEELSRALAKPVAKPVIVEVPLQREEPKVRTPRWKAFDPGDIELRQQLLTAMGLREEPQLVRPKPVEAKRPDVRALAKARFDEMDEEDDDLILLALAVDLVN